MFPHGAFFCCKTTAKKSLKNKYGVVFKEINKLKSLNVQAYSIYKTKTNGKHLEFPQTSKLTLF